MSYFTAVLAKVGEGWKARDVEVDTFADVDELAEALRSVAVADQPVLAVLEHEDDWFALVRVDGDAEPRLFVSAAEPAFSGRFGELLAPAAEVDGYPDPALSAGEEDEEEDLDVPVAGAGLFSLGDDEDDGEDPPPESAEEDPEDDSGTGRPRDLPVWAGDATLLTEFGVPGPTLATLVEQRGEDPGAVLGEIGEVVGFGEVLESLR